MTAATSSVWALWHINCSLEMCLTKLPMLVESPMDLWTMKQHVQIWSLGEMGAVVVKPIFELLFLVFADRSQNFHSEINLGFLTTTSKPGHFNNTDVSQGVICGFHWIYILLPIPAFRLPLVGGVYPIRRIQGNGRSHSSAESFGRRAGFHQQNAGVGSRKAAQQSGPTGFFVQQIAGWLMLTCLVIVWYWLRGEEVWNWFR